MYVLATSIQQTARLDCTPVLFVDLTAVLQVPSLRGVLGTEVA